MKALRFLVVVYYVIYLLVMLTVFWSISVFIDSLTYRFLNSNALPGLQEIIRIVFYSIVIFQCILTILTAITTILNKADNLKIVHLVFHFILIVIHIVLLFSSIQGLFIEVFIGLAAAIPVIIFKIVQKKNFTVS
jgi:hypothetical protein